MSAPVAANEVRAAVAFTVWADLLISGRISKSGQIRNIAGGGWSRSSATRRRIDAAVSQAKTYWETRGLAACTALVREPALTCSTYSLTFAAAASSP